MYFDEVMFWALTIYGGYLVILFIVEKHYKLKMLEEERYAQNIKMKEENEHIMNKIKLINAETEKLLTPLSKKR